MKEKNEFNSPLELQKAILGELNEEKGKEWYNSPYDIQYEILKEISEGGVVKEAPEDGKIYGRKDGDWAEIGGGNFEVVVADELPEASESTQGKIYLIPSTDPQSQNVRDEFITVHTVVDDVDVYEWEQIGSTAIDLSDYYTKDETDDLLGDKADSSTVTAIGDRVTAAEGDIINIEQELDEKQDTLTAGEGIDITDGVISTTGGGSGDEEHEEVVADAYRQLNRKVDVNQKVVNNKVDNVRKATNDVVKVTKRSIYKDIKEDEGVVADAMKYSVVSNDGVKFVKKLTEDEYEAITSPDSNTLYLITEE